MGPRSGPPNQAEPHHTKNNPPLVVRWGKLRHLFEGRIFPAQKRNPTEVLSSLYATIIPIAYNSLSSCNPLPTTCFMPTGCPSTLTYGIVTPLSAQMFKRTHSTPSGIKSSISRSRPHSIPTKTSSLHQQPLWPSPPMGSGHAGAPFARVRNKTLLCWWNHAPILGRP